jgi:hypothetical protein
MRKKSGMILTAFAATVALGAASHEATAEQMGAYLLFELTGSDTAAVTARLESTSLGNCKQLLVGDAPSDEVIFHLLCDEDEGTTNMSQAVVELARVDGVRRATVLAVKGASQ